LNEGCKSVRNKAFKKQNLENDMDAEDLRLNSIRIIES